MDILNQSKGLIWDKSLFVNPHLCLKIRKVAHNQMIEVLTLAKKKIALASIVYKNMYLDIFRALIAKQIASKKRDTITSTPSITNLEDYMEQHVDTPQHIPKCEPEEIQVPQDNLPEHPYMDPAVKNTIANTLGTRTLR